MNKLVFTIVAILFTRQICLSQNVLWERRLSWEGRDKLSDIVAADSSNYLAIGLSDRYGFNVPGGSSIYGLALIKFDQYGDTNFVRHLGGYYTYDTPYLCRGDSGEVFILVRLGFTSRNIQVIKIDYEGNILDEFSVPNNSDIGFAKILYTKKKELLLIGRNFGITRDSMQIIKLNRNGIVLINNNFSGGGTITTGNYIEETPNGTYLASGTTSSNIWAVELDSNGNQIQQGLLYRNSQNLVFSNVAVKAAPDNRFIAAGNFGISNGGYYLGSHDGLTNIKNWGGEEAGISLPPIILNEGSFVHYVYKLVGGIRTQYFTKYSPDSIVIWRVPMTSSFGALSGQFSAYSFLDDSSVIAVGQLNYNSPTSQDFYIARISGVGVPYDPTTPVATKPQLGSRGGISIWPQPASHANGGALHFGGFAGPATLALYNMKGQQVLPVPGTAGTTTTTLLPRQPVAIGHLPPGLYVYRLVAKDRVWTGKVVLGE